MKQHPQSRWWNLRGAAKLYAILDKISPRIWSLSSNDSSYHAGYVSKLFIPSSMNLLLQLRYLLIWISRISHGMHLCFSIMHLLHKTRKKIRAKTLIPNSNFINYLDASEHLIWKWFSSIVCTNRVHYIKQFVKLLCLAHAVIGHIIENHNSVLA